MITAILSQKGGVGKSTIAICLAVEAMKRKRPALLVDSDPQGTARTWGAVAEELGQPAPPVIAAGADMHRELPKLVSQYDRIYIDGPPRHGEIQKSAIMAADLVVVPCGPSAADAWALGETLDLLTRAKEVRPELVAVVLINRVKVGTAIGKGARDVMKESGLPVLRTELADRVAYQEALAAGQGVTTYAPTSTATVEVTNLFNELGRMVK